ncbi:EpsG family protein [Aeromonas veronii]
MSIYYVTIFICLFYGVIYQQSSHTVRSTLNFVFIFSFLIIFGFRYQVGVDWFNYIEVYNRHVNSTVLFDTTELGYKTINLLAHYVDKGIVTTILLSTLLFILFTVYGISLLKLNPYYFFALVSAYHFVMSGMNFTRQAIALSVMLMAFGFLIQKRRRGFLLLTLFAGFFHTSAWCFFPLIFIDGKLRYIFLAITTIVPLLVHQMSDVYSLYLDTEMDNAGLYLRALFLLPCAFFVFLNFKKFNSDVVIKRLMLLVILSFPFVVVVSVLSSTIADRFSYYFILLGALLVYYQFYRLGGWQIKKLNRYGPVTLFLANMIALITWHMYSGYIPSYMFDSYLLHWYWN